MTSDSFNVSPQQEQLWTVEPDGPSVRTQAVVRLNGSLDPAELEAALQRTVQRHESLRTTFAHQAGLRIPVQVVNEQLDPGFTTRDLRSLDAGEQASERQRVVDQELAEPFAFAAGPLLRAVLLTWAEQRSELVLTASALCADPSSMSLLVGELASQYAGAGDKRGDDRAGDGMERAGQVRGVGRAAGG